MNEPKIFFLVKANRKIGGGHFVRCIILANALKKKQVESFFLVMDTDTAYLDLLRSKSLTYEPLIPQPYELTNLITKKMSPYPRSLLVVDTDDPTFHSPAFQKEIVNSGFLLMIITIKPYGPYHAHILLNQNPIALNHTYDVEDYTKKLLGPQYFILSEPFRTESTKRKPHNSTSYNLFISFGTADAFNITLAVLKACGQIIDKKLINNICVVAGEQNPHHQSIRDFIEGSDMDIQLHVNPVNIRALMVNSDIAITSAGLTFWELASVKVPSLIIPASEREIETAIYLHQNKLGYYLSQFDQLSDTRNIACVIEKILNMKFQEWIDNERFENLVNPHGIDNVVSEILTLLSD